MLLPGLVNTLLHHLLELRVEFLHEPIKALLHAANDRLFNVITLLPSPAVRSQAPRSALRLGVGLADSVSGNGRGLFLQQARRFQEQPAGVGGCFELARFELVDEPEQVVDQLWGTKDARNKRRVFDAQLV